MFPILAQVPDLKGIAEGDNYTLNGVLLIAFGIVAWAMWTGFSALFCWLGGRIDKVIDRGIVHLETVDSTMDSLKTAISSIHPRLDSLETRVTDVKDRVDSLNEFLRERRGNP